MWPFNSKTLYDRYSKLIKLIMSIDSHFEVTENKEDSVRLHLPNYKGNQPMDFHICLMEPFLFIKFDTEIEGEKISVVNNYPQDTDQQDMFNMAMSNNMNKIHQVLEKKYKEEQEEKKRTEETNYSSGNSQESQSNGIPIESLIEDLKENFDYNASFKRHALTFMILRPNSEFWYYSRPDAEKPLWIYNDKKNDKDRGVYMMDESYAIGLYPLLWYYKKYDDKESLCWLFDFLDRHNIDLWAQDYFEEAVDDNHPEELIKKMKRYVPSLKIGNNPQKIKENLSWAWIDIQSLLLFINYCMNSLDWSAKPDESIDSLQDCSSISDLAYLIFKDMGVEHKLSSMKEAAENDLDENNDVYVQEEDEELIIVESWPLLDFARQHGTMKVTNPWTHVNRRTGEEYEARSCAFVHPTKKDEQGRAFVLFVEFSSKLGELSAKEIAAQQKELVVVKYKSGEYALDRKQVITTPNEEISTQVTDDDLKNAWVDEYGVKYSADRKRLLNVPRKIEEYTIMDGTAVICDKAFLWSELSCIKIPNSVKILGNQAFMNCKKIIEVAIPSGLLSIGEESFFGCENMKRIDIPSSVEKMGKSSFHGCSSLMTIDIPNNITIIEESLFDGCSSLSSINFPNNVVSIGKSAFSDCVKIASIKLPDNINQIGENAFWGCESLTTIDIPENVKSIGACAFCDCTSLIRLTIPNCITNIEESLFWGCSSLTDIDIPGTVTSIGENSFAGCVKLTGIKIPDNVTSIGESAFIGCENLTNINIPLGITEIMHNSFRDCVELESVTIPKGVKNVEEGAFMGCTSLRFVTILGCETNIEETAFKNCLKLESIIVPDGTRNKYEGFLPDYKERLTENSETNEDTHAADDNWWADENGNPYIFDYMPSSSNSDNEETDEDLMNEEEVIHTDEKTEDDLENVWTDEYGVQYSEDKKQLIYVPEDVEDYSIAEGTEEIGDYAFVNIECEDVSYDYIMENDLDIEDFERHPSKLVSVTIPNSVTKIGKGIFDWCTNLAVISIPEGTTERFKKWLPDYEDIFVEGDISTAAHLGDIEEVWIDEYGVKYTIDKRKLLKVPTDITKCIILPGTKIICDGAFFECKNLNNIHLPESIRIIGKYAFYGCDSLSEINLPKAILMIGEHSFDECRMLESLYIPKNGYSQFAGMLPSLYKKIKVSPLNSVIDEDGVVYDNDYQILHFNTLPLDTYTVKFGVKAIDNYAFKPAEWKKDDGKSLKRLVLPDSIVIVGVGAFCYNERLEYINIPSSVVFQSEENPFAGCSNLHTIKWETHGAVKEGTLIFNRNKTELVACLPWHYIDGVQKSWTLQSFAKQFGKMQVRDFVDQQTGEEFKSCVFTKPDGTHTFVEFSSSADSIPPHKIPEMMNELQVVMMETGNYSLFKGKTIIEQESIVELPDGLETIAANAFYHNEVLKEIKLPDTITDIGKNAFEGCISLSSIYIPLGTLDKFDKLLPELKHLLDEVDDLPF